MNVVLEGPDGAGKSTIAERLKRELGIKIQPGDGPPKQPGEIERRLRRYLEMDGVVFDRHPAVSQMIYGTLRNEPASDEFVDMVTEFYSQKPFVVYCRSTSSSRHVVKPGENEVHVATLTARYMDLVQAYDRWACARASYIYRIGDDAETLIDCVRIAVP